MIGLIATAVTTPVDLDQPFNCWTLDRLETYLNETCHIAINRSRIDEMGLAEGWRADEPWFSERVDPDVAGKRGRLNASTPNHQRGA